MPSRPPLLYASRMKLRPNPTMQLHLMLAKRSVLHIDVFAAVREQSPDTVLFSIELRRGGRGDPLEHDWWIATFNTFTPPVRRDLRTAAHYDVTDTVRFNSLRADWYAWAVRYHHQFILPLIGRYQRPGFKHRSILFHYFKAYDLDPAKGFQNFTRLTAGQRYRALNWNERKPADDGSELL